MATKTKAVLPAKTTNKKVKDDMHLKSSAELVTLVKKIKQEIMKEKLFIRAGREKNTRSNYNKRKLLARALSVLREKELEIKA